MAHERVPEYRFRSFGEIITFLPAVLATIVLQLCNAAGVSEETCSQIWIAVLTLCVVGACIDLWWLPTLTIALILFLLPLAAEAMGITVIGQLLSWLIRHDGIVTVGAMNTFSKHILVLFGAVWITRLLSYYEVSPNRFESVYVGRRDWSENAINLTVSPTYENFFKQFFCFGLGDLRIEREGQEIRRIEDIPFLWFRWPKIEAIIKQTAVTLVEQPPHN